MPQNFTLQCRGLYTYPNTLSEIPQGALTTADNVVIDRPGVVNPRRGFGIYGTSSSAILKQLMTYKERLFRHYGTTIDWDSDGAGTFVTLATNITEQGTGRRISSAQSNGNLYFTSNAGIQKISAASVSGINAITEAGVAQALDGTATINTTQGWFTQDSTVAYRVVWGIKDANQDVLLGVPSSRIIIGNPMLSLLITDMNDLLQDLTTVGANNASGTFHDTTLTTYILSKNATSEQVYNVLSVLATNSSCLLDTDLSITGAGVTTVSTSPTVTMASTAGIVIGMKVSGNANIPGGTTVLSVAANGTQLTLSANATGNATLASTNFTNVTFQNIAPVPAEPSIPGTTAELLSLQAYYDAIVNALNTHVGITGSAKVFIGGAFSNSTQTATTNLNFFIPDSITVNHFYQVYRSALFSSVGGETLSNVSPDDELFLIQEGNPVSGDLSNGYIAFQDIVPDVFRENGTPLYTNANSGQGIAQANYAPPVAQDITLFNNTMFFANTQNKQYLQFNLLTALGLTGKTFTITENSTPYTLNFVATVNQVVNIHAIAGSLFTSSGTADYFDLHTPASGPTYRIWFQTGTAVAPSAVGVTLVACNVLNTDTSTQVGTKLTNTLTILADFSAYNKFIGDVYAGSAVVQNISDTSGLVVGMGVSGTGIPGSTTIATITADTITLSANATQDQLANTITLVSNVITTNENSGICPAPSEHVVDAGFTLTVLTTGNGENASTQSVGVSNAATPAQQVDETARSMVRIITQQAAWPIIAFYQSGVTDVPGIIRLENASLASPVFYLTSSLGSSFFPTLAPSGTVNASANDTIPNRLYWSKTQQPESVPLVNFQDVGPKDKAILRIVALRDSLFILSQDGIYQLTGTDPTTFTIALFDNTTRILAPDSASVLNNQVFMLSDQGVVQISSTGVSVISQPIEDSIQPLITYTNFLSATFAVSYNTDRSYLLFAPQSSADTYATECFRYNSFTQTWVRWPVMKNCGVVEPITSQFYVGPTDVTNVEKERKSYTRLDYADRSYSLSVLAQSIVGNIINAVPTTQAVSGDVLVQTQYLTVSDFNRCLRRLDGDPNLTFKSYFTTYQGAAGLDLRALLGLLAAKLDTDHTEGGYASAISGYTSSFHDQQLAFNVITARLNSDSNVAFRNYPTSSGTLSFEAPITTVNPQSMELAYTLPFIAGDIVLYKAIESTIIWAPQHFGDPSTTKHVREGTFLFDSMEFTKAFAFYGSDLRPGPTAVPVIGEGTGTWGNFAWGQINFGGAGSSRPFRTLLPLDKQRCRFLLPEWQHAAAFEKYALLGISFTYELISSRGWR